MKRTSLPLQIPRRDFIARISTAVATWPLAARAQQPGRMRRIGVLMGGAETDPESPARVRELQQGLEKLGWKIGRNLQIDYQWTTADRAEWHDSKTDRPHFC